MAPRLYAQGRLWALFSPLLLCVACGGPPRRKVVSACTVGKPISVVEVAQVPFPESVALRAVLAEAGPSEVPPQKAVSYVIEEDLRSLYTFYHREMEMAGWIECTSFNTVMGELLILFEKPSRWCMVHMQPVPYQGQLRVTVYIGQKEHVPA